MSEVQQDLPALKMWRPDKPLAVSAPPEGFRVRPLRDDEGEAWCSCLLGDMGVDCLSQELFHKKMLDDPEVPANSILCVEDENGVPVATATAQVKEGNRAFLHNVGVREDMRGKGLGFFVCAAVVGKHLTEGRGECMLTTHDWRLPALKQYLKLGFLPCLFHDSMRGRWETILNQLRIDKAACVNEDLSPAGDLYAAEN